MLARKASFSKRSHLGGEERELKTLLWEEDFNIKKTNMVILMDGLVNLSLKK